MWQKYGTGGTSYEKVKVMSQNTVLICDDNPVMHEGLSSYLEAEGIRVLSAFNGKSALEILKSEPVDVIILDVMMPGMDGFEVCREIRRTSDVHIIMISAKGEDIDRILGLELGADDYLTKPVSPREVTIRVKKAIKKKEPGSNIKKFTLAELTVYPDQYQAFINDQEIQLTTKELEVLAFMMANKGRVLTREHILNAAWGFEYYGDTRAVDTLIKRLRQKLAGDNLHFAITTVYSIGYKIEEKI